MNDRQIACFLEAVKERNFTKVAEKLYLTQPGVSRMIATLEKELNTKLFARSAHKTLELTESGKLYYEMFEKCRREFEETICAGVEYNRILSADAGCTAGGVSISERGSGKPFL